MRAPGPDAPADWFFIRGLAREGGHWGDFLERFVAGAPGARAHALDLPGFGTRARETSPASIGGIVDELQREFTRARSPDRRAYLFAISLGGMVAAEWMKRDPEAFAAVTLVNSSYRGWSPLFRRLTPEAAMRLVGIVSRRNALARERAVLSMVSNRPELRERTAKQWAAIDRERPARPENFIRQLWAASRFQAPAHAPGTPILVLSSARDRMVHPSCSKEIARRWNLPLRSHPTAGHDLPLDDADWTIEQTLEWTRQLPAMTTPSH